MKCKEKLKHIVCCEQFVTFDRFDQLDQWLQNVLWYQRHKYTFYWNWKVWERKPIDVHIVSIEWILEMFFYKLILNLDIGESQFRNSKLFSNSKLH